MPPHPRFGGELTYGQGIVLSETPAEFTRAGPGFGQDTRDVLRDVAGLDDGTVQAVIDSGTAHEMPHPELHLERPYLHWIPTVMPLDWPASSQVDPAGILFNRLASWNSDAGGSEP